MGRLFTVSLEGKIYACKHCGTHLALHEDVLTKFLNSRHGECYLFNKAVNVTRGKFLDRTKMTWLNTVAFIYCVGCGAMLGFTYESTPENSQKYKEGNSVIKRSMLSFQCPDEGSPA